MHVHFSSALFDSFVQNRPVHRPSINRIIEGVPINRIAFGLND